MPRTGFNVEGRTEKCGLSVTGYETNSTCLHIHNLKNYLIFYLLQLITILLTSHKYIHSQRRLFPMLVNLIWAHIINDIFFLHLAQREGAAK